MTNESERDIDESPMKISNKKEPLSYNPDLILKDDQESPKKKRKSQKQKNDDSLFENERLSPVNKRTSAKDVPNM